MARKISKKKKLRAEAPQNLSNVTQIVQERAYSIWESKGRPQNSALNDWLEAKRQLKIEKSI
jgi:hypothetical protein